MKAPSFGKERVLGDKKLISLQQLLVKKSEASKQSSITKQSIFFFSMIRTRENKKRIPLICILQAVFNEFVFYGN
jgi:hypothetical protein